jgi:hypothetical protein
MYLDYSVLYGVSCVVVERGNEPEAVMAYARDNGATITGDEEKIFVVRLPGDEKEGAYTRSALCASFPV